MQGCLRPHAPEPQEGGHEVDGLLPVGVVEHVGGGVGVGGRLLRPGHPGVEDLKQQPQGCYFQRR